MELAKVFEFYLSRLIGKSTIRMVGNNFFCYLECFVSVVVARSDAEWFSAERPDVRNMLENFDVWKLKVLNSF